MTLKPFDKRDFGAKGLQTYRIAESIVISKTDVGRAKSEAVKFLATVPADAQAEARAKYVAE